MYRILLLDDDNDDLELMAELLSRQSRVRFHVVAVHTVEEAEWHVRHNAFDLLIVDYHLAGAFREMQGTDFIKHCRRHGLRAPVLLVSGQSRVLLDQEILAMISSGDLQFMSKQEMDSGALLAGVFSLVCRPVRVLLVDDCQQQADDLKKVLVDDEFHRFRVHIEHGLAEALAYARSNSVDVIVVKHGLPPFGGIELVRRFIDEGRGQNSAFVLLADPKLLVDDYAALCMIGRRRIEFQSPDTIATGAIIPAIVRAYNDNLAERYYGSLHQIERQPAALTMQGA